MNNSLFSMTLNIKTSDDLPTQNLKTVINIQAVKSLRWFTKWIFGFSWIFLKKRFDNNHNSISTNALEKVPS